MSYNLSMKELIKIIREQTPPGQPPLTNYDYGSIGKYLNGYMDTYFPSSQEEKNMYPIDKYVYIEKRI